VSTAYRQAHVKTTIGVETIDPSTRRLGYFHNSGYYAIEGDDFDGVFPGHSAGDDHLPPYIEVAKLDRSRPVPTIARQADVARRLLSHHVAWMPSSNPFTRYRDRYQADVDHMRSMGTEKGGERFHAYAFAYFRQFGSAFFEAAAHLRWLAANGGVTAVHAEDVAAAAVAFETISSSAKTLQLRTARAAMTGKAFDGSASLDAMATAWQTAADLLRPTAAC
jgi:Domain of unknown function (DUF1839)